MRSSTRSSAQRGRHLGGAVGAAGSVLRGPAAGWGNRDLPDVSGRGGPGNGRADGGAGNGDRPDRQALRPVDPQSNQSGKGMVM